MNITSESTTDQDSGQQLATLFVEGEIDLYNAQALKKEIQNFIDNNIPKIVVNLNKASYIDSSGIGVLIVCSNNAKKADCALELAEVPDNLKRVFELTRLNNFFKI